MRTPTIKDKEEKKKRSLKNNQASIDMEQEYQETLSNSACYSKAHQCLEIFQHANSPINVTSLRSIVILICLALFPIDKHRWRE